MNFRLYIPYSGDPHLLDKAIGKTSQILEFSSVDKPIL